MPDKIIKGTKDKKKYEVLKGPADSRQVRCTKCRQGLAIQVPDGQGGFVHKCQVCKAEFLFQKI